MSPEARRNRLAAKHMRKTIRYFIAGGCIVAMMLLSGCTVTYRGYEGAARPKDEIAVLNLGSQWSLKQKARAKQVDGTFTIDKDPDLIELLPGEHSITFFPKYGFANEVTEDIVVEPGKTYLVKPFHNPNGSSDILSQGSWWVMIIDHATGNPVDAHPEQP
jgi:hypothetical protein